MEQEKIEFPIIKVVVLLAISVLISILFLNNNKFQQRLQEKYEEKQFLETYKNIEYDDYENKLIVISQMLKKFPNNIEALTFKGYIEMKINQTGNSIITNEKVIELDPKNSSALNNLSWAYLTNENYNLSLHFALEALENNRFSYNSYELYNTASSYQGLEKYHEAIEYFDRTILQEKA